MNNYEGKVFVGSVKRLIVCVIKATIKTIIPKSLYPDLISSNADNENIIILKFPGKALLTFAGILVLQILTTDQ